MANPDMPAVAGRRPVQAQRRYAGYKSASAHGARGTLSGDGR